MISRIYEFVRKNVGKKPKEEESNFEWISAEHEEEEAEPLPMFYVGDRLHIYDPHMGEIFYEEDSFGPALYEVKEVTYDEEDEVFRYKLEGISEWVSEDWLSLPFYSRFSKPIKKERITIEIMEEEALGKALDEFARKNEIDRLLDVMNSDVPESDRSVAKERLRELTSVE